MHTLSRRERERTLRREALLDVAATVFFEQGFDASIEAIAARAGIAKGTVYLSFASKDDILLLLVCRGLDRMIAMFDEAAASGGDARARVLAFGEAYHRFSTTEPDYYRLLNDMSGTSPLTQAGDDVRAQLRERADAAWSVITCMLQEGIDSGALRGDLTAFEMAMILWSSATGVLRQISTMRAIEDPDHAGSSFSMQTVDTKRIYDATIALLADSLAR